MLNSNVPAAAIGLPSAFLLTASDHFNRTAIMRAAVALARQFREDDARMYRNKYSAQLRYGQPVPPMVVSTWQQAMREALRIVWRQAHEQRAMTPAIAAEIEAVEVATLTIQAAERPAPAELAQLAALQSRAAALRASLHA